MIREIFNKLFGKREEISFRQSFDLTELAVVTFYQGETKVNLLLDTGSNNNVIDKTSLEALYYEEEGMTSELAGLEGNAQTCKVCNITLHYKDKEYTYPYVVADMSKIFADIKKTTGVTVHGVMGSKFFHKYKYVLDFDKLVAYSK